MPDRPVHALLVLLALLGVLASGEGSVQRREAVAQRIERIVATAAISTHLIAPLDSAAAIPVVVPPLADAMTPPSRAIIRHGSRGPPSI